MSSTSSNTSPLFGAIPIPKRKTTNKPSAMSTSGLMMMNKNSNNGSSGRLDSPPLVITNNNNNSFNNNHHNNNSKNLTSSTSNMGITMNSPSASTGPTSLHSPSPHSSSFKPSFIKSFGTSLPNNNSSSHHQHSMSASISSSPSANKYKPCNLDISLVRSNKSKPKKFELPTEFYMYNSYHGNTSLHQQNHPGYISSSHNPHNYHSNNQIYSACTPSSYSSTSFNNYPLGTTPNFSYGSSLSSCYQPCYSLSSSLESNCSYTSCCVSPNGNNLLMYDRGNRIFQKIKTLGEGSSSTVHLVKQEGTGLLFAEKVIDSYEEREAVVQNEVKYLSICKPCQNVVTLYDCFQRGNSIHLILEYMEGNSLDVILKNYANEDAPLPESDGMTPLSFGDSGDDEDLEFDDLEMDDECNHALFAAEDTRMTKKDHHSKHVNSTGNVNLHNHQNTVNNGLPENILALMSIQIVRALCFLKENNIIHSDIKPSNILLNRKGEVKLTDFGLSTSDNLPQNRRGSFAYFSPEKLQQGKHSHKGDIYSFGISLLELAKRKFPFSEHGFHLNEIYHFDIDKFLGDSFSDVFKDFVKKSMNIDADQRYCAHQLVQHEFLKPYVNMSYEAICSKLADWYNNL
ncbi:hypothetical protein ABK040_008013 [Willaertia magna]